MFHCQGGKSGIMIICSGKEKKYDFGIVTPTKHHSSHGCHGEVVMIYPDGFESKSTRGPWFWPSNMEDDGPQLSCRNSRNIQKPGIFLVQRLGDEKMPPLCAVPIGSNVYLVYLIILTLQTIHTQEKQRNWWIFRRLLGSTTLLQCQNV
jgi:hypothetical protein